MNFHTKAIHSAHEPEPVTGAVMPPIFMTSTFAQEAPGEHKGYDYTRAGNPNFTQLEAGLAALEEAQYATAFSSGLGATTAILSTLSQGDTVVAINGLYGGTYRLFTKIFQRFGINFIFCSEEEVPAQLLKKPKLLFLETPNNPLLQIVDITNLSALAKASGVLTLVDNTFATPYFQNPILLGADLVLHSTTKYIGGHSDVVGGVIMTNNASLKESLDFNRMSMGVHPSPFDAWLILRGIKTLGIRMERHEHNAMKLARFLEGHEQVKKVYYPGLESHLKHSIAKKQMSGFSGIVSVEFDFSIEQAKKLISSLKIFTLAESLGGVESLVCHPASMTHASIPKEERARIGLSDGLMRFSVGIESYEDIVQDVKSALQALTIMV